MDILESDESDDEASQARRAELRQFLLHPSIALDQYAAGLAVVVSVQQLRQATALQLDQWGAAAQMKKGHIHKLKTRMAHLQQHGALPGGPPAPQFAPTPAPPAPAAASSSAAASLAASSSAASTSAASSSAAAAPTAASAAAAGGWVRSPTGEAPVIVLPQRVRMVFEDKRGVETEYDGWVRAAPTRALPDKRNSTAVERHVIEFDDGQSSSYNLTEEEIWLLPAAAADAAAFDGEGVAPAEGSAVKLDLRCAITMQPLTDPAKGCRCAHPPMCNNDVLRVHVSRSKDCPIFGCDAELKRPIEVVKDDRLREFIAGLPAGVDAVWISQQGVPSLQPPAGMAAPPAAAEGVVPPVVASSRRRSTPPPPPRSCWRRRRRRKRCNCAKRRARTCAASRAAASGWRARRRCATTRRRT